MKTILSILLENESGALSRIIGLFSQRDYNIESLTVAPTDDPTISRMTIQTIGEKKVIEQIEKQLHKLIDVLKVTNMNKFIHLKKEIMLIKIHVNKKIKSEIYQNTTIFKGKIIDITLDTYIIQLSGSSNTLDTFVKLIKNTTQIIEIVRSGVIGISKK
ncbi:MAG: acetolactate synthase small subunit [Buchnera aphidicola (Eriosoma harunire)]